ncbi:hypothetical protein BH09PSE5_BH09PSE5_35760 [soil metagenome]
MRILSIDPMPGGVDGLPGPGAQFLRQSLVTSGMEVCPSRMEDNYDSAYESDLVMLGIADGLQPGSAAVFGDSSVAVAASVLASSMKAGIAIARQPGPRSSKSISSGWAAYGWAAELAVEFAALMSRRAVPPGLFLNISVPERLHTMKPVVTVLHEADLDRIDGQRARGMARTMWRSAARLDLQGARLGTDAEAIADGLVSISPIRWWGSGWHVDTDALHWARNALHDLLPRLLGEPQDCACCAPPSGIDSRQDGIDSPLLPINVNHPIYQRSNT